MCGKYLARLAKEYPERFSQHKEEGLTIWTIQPPPGRSKAKYPSFSEETAARVRAGNATRLTDEADTVNRGMDAEYESEVAELAGQCDDAVSPQSDPCLVS